ncbi:unnamed protein product [Mycena citricolor]|uniref:C2H2-type domain-containing protein n=1 Tax=Mycena citricolor TaxID=2018698 RepID=A0AAD2Q6V9_9AGAR|nr:unnamed protein product [Mycena citricolor]
MSAASSSSRRVPHSFPPMKNHLCPLCQRAFSTTGHLTRHVKIHTGEKNHLCPFPGCTTRCSRQDNLQQHLCIVLVLQLSHPSLWHHPPQVGAYGDSIAAAPAHRRTPAASPPPMPSFVPSSASCSYPSSSYQSSSSSSRGQSPLPTPPPLEDSRHYYLGRARSDGGLSPCFEDGPADTNSSSSSSGGGSRRNSYIDVGIAVPGGGGYIEPDEMPAPLVDSYPAPRIEDYSKELEEQRIVRAKHRDLQRRFGAGPYSVKVPMSLTRHRSLPALDIAMDETGSALAAHSALVVQSSSPPYHPLSMGSEFSSPVSRSARNGRTLLQSRSMDHLGVTCTSSSPYDASHLAAYAYGYNAAEMDEEGYDSECSSSQSPSVPFPADYPSYEAPHEIHCQPAMDVSRDLLQQHVSDFPSRSSVESQQSLYSCDGNFVTYPSHFGYYEGQYMDHYSGVPAGASPEGYSLAAGPLETPVLHQPQPQAPVEYFAAYVQSPWVMANQ